MTRPLRAEIQLEALRQLYARVERARKPGLARRKRATVLRFRLITSVGLLLAACDQPANEPAPSAVEPPSAPAATVSQSVPRKPAPVGARVYIIAPQSGETVSSPVRVVFGLAGAGVAPAGTAAPNSGHHHLLIDTPLPALDAPIPADERHVHFGGGQTETSLSLTPGTHTLQLLLADESHVPHDPPLFSDVVTIEVR
jgi:hypothetical protein